MITNSFQRKLTECYGVLWSRIYCTFSNHLLLSDTPYMQGVATFLATLRLPTDRLKTALVHEFQELSSDTLLLETVVGLKC